MLPRNATTVKAFEAFIAFRGQMTRSRGLSWCLVALSISAARVTAQEAVIIGGHVSAAGNPVQGATVRIPALGLSSTTTSEGRYSLIVPSIRVRGQTVDLVARHVRYNIESTPITLTGGSLIKDFELTPAGDPRAEARGTNAGPVDVRPVASRVALTRTVVDSTAYDEAAGPVDVVSGLAGRIAGVIVTTPSTMGGSAPIVVRGYRSIVNAVQPLFVVDGVPLENSTFATPGQVFGSGGFDYGTPVQSLNPTDIATVTVLRGPEAAALYGGRAANGVLLITTKNGRGLSGLEVSAAQQFTGDAVLKLPSFQNSYGQGLGGKFEFFDGAGGGTNDAVAENWGPALDGQAVAQFSFTQPRKGRRASLAAISRQRQQFLRVGADAEDRGRGPGRERSFQRTLFGKPPRYSRGDSVEQSGAPGRGRRRQ